MADDLSSVLGGNQTMEQLGSSLLQKQATDRAATQKADKKSKRVGQALAVMGNKKLFYYLTKLLSLKTFK